MPVVFKKSSLIVLVVIVSIAAVGALVTSHVKETARRESSALAQIQQGETLPYTDFEGAAFDLEQYRGKVLVVNSWASWSPLSRDELTMLALLKQKYADILQVVAINRMESKAVAEAFIAAIGKPEGVVFLLDPNDTFYLSIEGFAMPETVVYDTEGNKVVHRRGSLTREEIERYILEAQELQ